MRTGSSTDSPDPRIDTRGIPSHTCLNCGCDLFLIRARFEDYEIALWFTEGTCAGCDAPVTVPTPLDNPLKDLL